MAMFGFAPNPLGSNPSELYWSDVLYVYLRMVSSLQGSENIPGSPTGGYTDLEAGPALICGDASWVWLDLDSIDPWDDAGRKLRESQADDLTERDVGAWYYKGRYRIVQQKTDSIGYCVYGTLAVTFTTQDFIQLCESSFSPAQKNKVSPVRNKNSIRIYTRLDATRSLGVNLVHELAHWFGSDSYWSVRDVPDQISVNTYGQLIYRDQAGKLVYRDKPNPDPALGLKPVVTYGFEDLRLLAMIHANPPGSINGGPRKSTFTADSYATFATMAYLDNWDWSHSGKASTIRETLPGAARRATEFAA